MKLATKNPTLVPCQNNLIEEQIMFEKGKAEKGYSVLLMYKDGKDKIINNVDDYYYIIHKNKIVFESTIHMESFSVDVSKLKSINLTEAWTQRPDMIDKLSY